MFFSKFEGKKKKVLVRPCFPQFGSGRQVGHLTFKLSLLKKKRQKDSKNFPKFLRKVFIFFSEDPEGNPADQQLCTQWLFRASDIAHSAKPWAIHRKWSMRVVQATTVRVVLFSLWLLFHVIPNIPSFSMSLFVSSAFDVFLPGKALV